MSATAATYVPMFRVRGESLSQREGGSVGCDNHGAAKSFMTVQEVADFLRCSRSAVNRYCELPRNPLKHYRISARRKLFSHADVLAWLKNKHR